MTDMPNVTVRDGAEIRTEVTSYLVTAWPEDLAGNPDASSWCVTVERRGDGEWAVLRGDGSGGPRLSPVGEWTYDRHRYPLERALELAREMAPKVRIMGMTTLECIAWHRQQEANGG